MSSPMSPSVGPMTGAVQRDLVNGGWYVRRDDTGQAYGPFASLTAATGFGSQKLGLVLLDAE